MVVVFGYGLIMNAVPLTADWLICRYGPDNAGIRCRLLRWLAASLALAATTLALSLCSRFGQYRLLGSPDFQIGILPFWIATYGLYLLPGVRWRSAFLIGIAWPCLLSAYLIWWETGAIDTFSLVFGTVLAALALAPGTYYFGLRMDTRGGRPRNAVGGGTAPPEDPQPSPPSTGAASGKPDWKELGISIIPAADDRSRPHDAESTTDDPPQGSRKNPAFAEAAQPIPSTPQDNRP